MADDNAQAAAGGSEEQQAHYDQRAKHEQQPRKDSLHVKCQHQQSYQSHDQQISYDTGPIFGDA